MFTLLHTNDFHNHLSQKQASRLQEERLSLGIRGLLLDAGDAISAGNITFHPGGEPILETMSAIGYDAMTVGNREFHFSRLGLRCKLSRARFPVLCANLKSSGLKSSGWDEATGAGILPTQGEPSVQGKGRRSDPYATPPDLPVLPYHLFPTPDGERILVFGLTVPMITRRMVVSKASAYFFEDPIATAGSLVPRLRDQYSPDLLIALTHIGIQQDRKLAVEVPGIDLIIGGHTHVQLPEGERLGSTLIVQGGCFGHWVGRIYVEAFAFPGRSPRLHARLEAL